MIFLLGKLIGLINNKYATMIKCTHRIVIECWPGEDQHSDHPWFWKIEEMVRILNGTETWIPTAYSGWEHTYHAAVNNAHATMKEFFGW